MDLKEFQGAEQEAAARMQEGSTIPRCRMAPGVESPVKARNIGREIGFAKALLIAVFVACGAIAVTLEWAAHRTGSLEAGIAYLSGAGLYCGPQTIEIAGDGVQRKEVTLRNLSPVPISILGYNAQCSCVSVLGLPMRIEPGQMRKASLLASSGNAKTVAVIFITDPPQATFSRVDVRVVPVAN
jgi:hypothetical protein